MLKRAVNNTTALLHPSKKFDEVPSHIIGRTGEKSKNPATSTLNPATSTNFFALYTL
jgi:hypothetical protein